jgi:hypothetical protein
MIRHIPRRHGRHSFLPSGRRLPLPFLTKPDQSFGERRHMARDHAIDLLHEFSRACRLEYDRHRSHQF